MYPHFRFAAIAKSGTKMMAKDRVDRLKPDKRVKAYFHLFIFIGGARASNLASLCLSC